MIRFPDITDKKLLKLLKNQHILMEQYRKRKTQKNKAKEKSKCIKCGEYFIRSTMYKKKYGVEKKISYYCEECWNNVESYTK